MKSSGKGIGEPGSRPGANAPKGGAGQVVETVIPGNGPTGRGTGKKGLVVGGTKSGK